MGVREMLDKIDSAELTEWQAYFALRAEDSGAAPRKASQADFRAAFASRVRRA